MGEGEGREKVGRENEERGEEEEGREERIGRRKGKGKEWREKELFLRDSE